MTNTEAADLIRRAIDKAIGAREAAPTLDTVPVVRCKDCKHWCTDSMPRMQDANVHFCVMVDFYSTADWFCAYGEPKEEEEWRSLKK